ncbi:MAG TPA: MFS transporter [Clostridiales bacterium]|nr:MFS transporter [Clostridiales bacterium]
MSSAVYTLDTVPLRKIHFRTFAYTLTGFFVAGYIIALISIALPYAVEELAMNALWQGLIGSAILIGILIGAFVFGKPADVMGRQKFYFWHFIAFVLLSLWAFFIHSAFTLFLMRFCCGLVVGIELIVGAAYLTEVIPSRVRGPWLAAMIATWVLGGLLGNVVTYAISDTGNWQLMLATGAVPAAIAALMGLGIPETVKWLLSKGEIDKAKEITSKYYGADIDITDQIETIRKKSDIKIKGQYSEVLSGKMLKRTVFGGLFWICQLVPYYAIATYTPTVLSTLGVGDGNSGTVLINVFATAGAVIGLLLMDKVPRRVFIIVTYILTFIPLILLGILGNLSGLMVSVLFCIGMFFLLMGSDLQNVYPPELFPTRVRGTGVGVVSSMSRIGGILGSFAFPAIMAAFGTAFAMTVCACFAVLGVIISYFWAPETRGIDVDDESLYI